MLLICTASSGHNRTLALRLSELAEGLGISNHVLDLTQVDLPVYTPERDEAGVPASLPAVEELFRAATGLFVCAPEYNGSIPPTLTNAIAWLSTQSDDFRSLFNGKAVGIGSHSGGGGQKVLVAMRLQFSHLGCNVIGREILTRSSKALRDESAISILKQLQSAMP